MEVSEKILAKARRIKLILMDADGVLTEGKVTYGDGNLELKSFDVKDGAGIDLARKAGIRTGIISGRQSGALQRRAKELRIDEVHQKVINKVEVYKEILGRYSLRDEEVAYIGDDILDLPLLLRVGLSAAVADAHPEVKKRVDLVTTSTGGQGAVRELIEFILRAQGRWDTIVQEFLS
ncbi:MAG: HAD hydrolase family protein [Candidatus Aminicenantes bacterium]|nr:HAD hydrolase family protein [Candidatus Aminicenantes bacterium]MDH5714608.1 HAD hydrolase family protein [Candidatus Aminicenantes bacterium]